MNTTTTEAKKRKLMSRLRELTTSAMKFRDFKSHGGTSKMWIDPKHRPVPLDGMHYVWLIENAVYVRKAFKLDMPDFTRASEQTVRLWALKNGFTRVNYTPNGTCTFETNKDFWSKKRQDVISMLISDNVNDIDYVVINVLNDDGSIYRDGVADVRGAEDVSAALAAVTMLDRKRTAIIAECLKRFG